MTTLVELTAVSKTYDGAGGRVRVAGEDLGRLSEARLAASGARAWASSSSSSTCSASPLPGIMVKVRIKEDQR